MTAGQRPTIHRSHRCRAPKGPRASAAGRGTAARWQRPDPRVEDSLSGAHLLLVACRHQPRKTPGQVWKKACRTVGGRPAAMRADIQLPMDCDRALAPSHISTEVIWAGCVHARVIVLKSRWGGTN